MSRGRDSRGVHAACRQCVTCMSISTGIPLSVLVQHFLNMFGLACISRIFLGFVAFILGVIFFLASISSDGAIPGSRGQGSNSSICGKLAIGAQAGVCILFVALEFARRAGRTASRSLVFATPAEESAHMLQGGHRHRLWPQRAKCVRAAGGEGRENTTTRATFHRRVILTAEPIIAGQRRW